MHLIINSKLANEKIIEVEIHKVNPTSVKYIGETENDNIEKNSSNICSLDVISAIKEKIGDNIPIMNAFERILKSTK